MRKLSCLLIGAILMAFLVEMFIPDQQEDMPLKCFENMVHQTILTLKLLLISNVSRAEVGQGGT